ncbi:hypothetical protein P7L84_02380 [Enterobacter ludwigii]|uniref:hypothetical protein n=3 Tax=Enterobacteriaceae TaxID=543 RepID=UPI000B0EAA34|nr:hypothetical protein [Enterobacter ludwigii]MDR0162418.1 hypothetical protein [Enterobacter ludwigii]
MAQIGHSPAERILRLCPVHYQGRQLNAARRTERAALICQYPACGISISETRNQFYCCKEHRDKARRLIDDDAIIRLVKHSYWLNVEAMLKNNSLGLGSITGPTDIADLIRLYQRKAVHQKTYNMLNGHRVADTTKRLIPWLDLELCHIYPNSKGGANIARNIIIAPAAINRMMKDFIPCCQSGVLSGIKAMETPQPVKSTLLKALTDKYGSDAVQEALYVVKRLAFADLSLSRRLFDTDIYAFPPLTRLLKEEALRLNLMSLWETLVCTEVSVWLNAGPANELFAVAAFHALLNGDGDRLLEQCYRLVDEIRVKHKRGSQQIYDEFQHILSQYMAKYFHIDTSDHRACNLFYNRFFSVPPVTEDGVCAIPPQ